MTLLGNLHSRHLDTDLHQVWLDDENDVAVFPLWNFSGQMAGYHMYRPNKDKVLNNHPYEGRYFTKAGEAQAVFWGIESWYLSNTLFLTEGLFDAARLTARGVSAVALFANNPKHHASWLRTLNRPVVAVCDAGKAGAKLAKYGTTSVTVPDEYGDVGDAPQSYVNDLVAMYK